MSDLFRFAQLQPFTLAGAGAVIGDTSITLKSMKDIDGNTLTMSGTFGDIGFGTLEPGSGTLEEQISFSGLTNNTNGTVTLTGVKNVSFIYPYTQTTGLAKTHAGAAPFIISNTSGFYDKLTSKSDDETITGKWTFPSADPNRAGIGSDVDTTEAVAFVTLGQLSRTAFTGGTAASETIEGFVQLATKTQAAAGTTTGSTGSRLVLPASMASATGASGTTVAVISQTNGTIAPAFIDQTGNYTWTGTTVFAGAVSNTGTSTNAGALVGYYDYQAFTGSGTWTKPVKLAGTEMVIVQLWGAGGGGGSDSGGTGGGGGGGAYNEAKFRVSDLGSTVSVTIGAGGGPSVVGGNSTFGSLLTAYGGGFGATGTSGTSTGSGGGGGGIFSVGVNGTAGNPATGAVGGTPLGGAAATASTFGGGGGSTSNAATSGSSVYGGGGGGCTSGTGGNSMYGGGGGGGPTNNGGTGLTYGNNGGQGRDDQNGRDGVAPGGGGGACGFNTGLGGSGARGECRVWVMK